MTWVWSASLPVTVLISPNIIRFDQPAFETSRDIAGVILWTMGFLMESVSDLQKYRFRSSLAGEGAVCDVGLFKWGRHSSYVGETLMQFC